MYMRLSDTFNQPFIPEAEIWAYLLVCSLIRLVTAATSVVAELQPV